MDVQTSVMGIDTLVGAAVSQTLIDSDIPLPEGRVAARVLCAGTQLGACEAQAQQDAVRASGSLTLLLLCESPSGEAFGFSAATTYVHSVELPGAAEGMAASAQAQVLECTCTAEAGRLHLSAILELSAQACAPESEPFVTGVSGVDALEVRETPVSSARAVPLGAASVRVREEAAAPAAQRVLLCHGAAQVREVIVEGGAATVEGSLYATLLTASEEGDLTQLIQIIPFTAVLDIPAGAAGAWAEAAVEQISAVAADMSFGVVDVEALVRVQVYDLARGEGRALLDAYDARGGIVCEQRTVEQLLCGGAEHKRFVFREGVQIPAELPEACRVIYAAATPAVTGMSAREGRLCVDAMVFVHALYQCDGGQLHAFPYDLPLQLELDAAYTPQARVTLQTLSAQLTGGGRTPELMLTLEARATLYERRPLTAAVRVEPAGTPRAPVGIVIYCAGAGETLWEVGKRFSVPLMRLREWNAALGDGAGADTVLEEGMRLVLPG